MTARALAFETSADDSGGRAGGAAVTIAQFAMQIQQQTNWCWAAVGASVVDFYGGPADLETQCSVATIQLAPLKCCNPAPPGNKHPCDQQASLKSVLTKLARLRTYHPSALPFAAVKASVDANAPLGVRIEWNDAEGLAHFVVVVGYQEDDDGPTIDVADPEDGVVTTLKFGDFPGSYRDGGRWTHSYETR